MAPILFRAHRKREYHIFGVIIDLKQEKFLLFFIDLGKRKDYILKISNIQTHML